MVYNDILDASPLKAKAICVNVKHRKIERVEKLPHAKVEVTSFGHLLMCRPAVLLANVVPPEVTCVWHIPTAIVLHAAPCVLN